MTRAELLERNQRRNGRDQAYDARNEAARRDIRLGKQRGWIMREHGLSASAYERLAGQVRGPWRGNVA